MLKIILGQRLTRAVTMKKLLCIFLVGLLSPTSLAAEKFGHLYFSDRNLKLTKQEKAAIALAEKWEKANANAGMKPITGPDGSVIFLYGAQHTSIVCAVLQVCDVALQPGESIRDINFGDPVRWKVDPSISGSGRNEVLHLIIKPWDVGLETTLIVTTDRRTYHFKLRSHKTKYMPKVSFSYPEDALAKWEAIKSREVKERKENTIPTTGEYLGDLSFEYRLSGKARWKPLRVYNDGRKTVIQMPDKMAQTETPTLLVIREDGSAKGETVMVNYRIQGDRYIVDSVFDKAIMIAGVGSK